MNQVRQSRYSEMNLMVACSPLAKIGIKTQISNENFVKASLNVTLIINLCVSGMESCRLKPFKLNPHQIKIEAIGIFGRLISVKKEGQRKIWNGNSVEVSLSFVSINKFIPWWCYKM